MIPKWKASIVEFKKFLLNISSRELFTPYVFYKYNLVVAGTVKHVLVHLTFLMFENACESFSQPLLSDSYYLKKHVSNQSVKT